MLGTLKVYTDGACSGNPGPGAFAYLVISPNDEILYKDVKRFQETTNNRMEMMAALAALRWLSSDPATIGNILAIDNIEIYSDSSYLVDGVGYLKGWKTRGWRKSTGGKLLNLDLWKELDKHLALLGNIQFKKVKGHNGDRFNEQCDSLARSSVPIADPQADVDVNYFLNKNKEV